MKSFGIYQAQYNLTTLTYESVASAARVYTPDVLKIQFLTQISPSVYLYTFEYTQLDVLQELFRQYKIYPVSAEEALGIMKRYTSVVSLREDRLVKTAEDILGVSSELSDLALAKLGRLAIAKYHMDSTANFVISDSLSDVVKALIVVGTAATTDELTNKQRERINKLMEDMREVYGDLNTCLMKSEKYISEVKSTMEPYATLKKRMTSCETPEEVWKI
jgi:hypothetical protein